MLNTMHVDTVFPPHVTLDTSRWEWGAADVDHRVANRLLADHSVWSVALEMLIRGFVAATGGTLVVLHVAQYSTTQHMGLRKSVYETAAITVVFSAAFGAAMLNTTAILHSWFRQIMPVADCRDSSDCVFSGRNRGWNWFSGVEAINLLLFLPTGVIVGLSAANMRRKTHAYRLKIAYLVTTCAMPHCACLVLKEMYERELVVFSRPVPQLLFGGVPCAILLMTIATARLLWSSLFRPKSVSPLPRPLDATSPTVPQLPHDLPNQMVCPLTRQLMQNPCIIVTCGHYCEAEDLIRHLGRDARCPSCSQPATTADIMLSYEMKEFIQHWKQMAENETISAAPAVSGSRRIIVQEEEMSAELAAERPQSAPKPSGDPAAGDRRSRDAPVSPAVPTAANTSPEGAPSRTPAEGSDPQSHQNGRVSGPLIGEGNESPRNSASRSDQPAPAGTAASMGTSVQATEAVASSSGAIPETTVPSAFGPNHLEEPRQSDEGNEGMDDDADRTLLGRGMTGRTAPSWLSLGIAMALLLMLFFFWIAYSPYMMYAVDDTPRRLRWGLNHRIQMCAGIIIAVVVIGCTLKFLGFLLVRRGAPRVQFAWLVLYFITGVAAALPFLLASADVAVITSTVATWHTERYGAAGSAGVLLARFVCVMLLMVLEEVWKTYFGNLALKVKTANKDSVVLFTLAIAGGWAVAQQTVLTFFMYYSMDLLTVAASYTYVTFFVPLILLVQHLSSALLIGLFLAHERRLDLGAHDETAPVRFHWPVWLPVILRVLLTIGAGVMLLENVLLTLLGWFAIVSWGVSNTFIIRKRWQLLWSDAQRPPLPGEGRGVARDVTSTAPQ